MTRSETALVHRTEPPTINDPDAEQRATDTAALALYGALEHQRARAIAAALNPKPTFEREKSLFARLMPRKTTGEQP